MRCGQLLFGMGTHGALGKADGRGPGSWESVHSFTHQDTRERVAITRKAGREAGHLGETVFFSCSEKRDMSVLSCEMELIRMLTPRALIEQMKVPDLRVFRWLCGI